VVFPSVQTSSQNYVTDLAVQAFKSKSGDPTRALFCYITLQYSGTHSRGTNDQLWCDVAQRDGPSINYLNSQRGPDGRASAGVNKAVLVETRRYVKETAIAAMDENNAIVCYTLGDAVSQCAYPAGNRCPGGSSDGFRPVAGSGEVVCRHVWIEGWGSSTYNSAYHNGLADAAEPLNVGSVKAIRVSEPLPIASGSNRYPSVTTLTEQMAVVCYTRVRVGTANSGQCTVIETDPAKNVWKFNAPIDCVNGYNCPHADYNDVIVRSKASARRSLTSKNQTRADANTTTTADFA